MCVSAAILTIATPSLFPSILSIHSPPPYVQHGVDGNITIGDNLRDKAVAARTTTTIKSDTEPGPPSLLTMRRSSSLGGPRAYIAQGPKCPAEFGPDIFWDPSLLGKTVRWSRGTRTMWLCVCVCVCVCVFVRAQSCHPVILSAFRARVYVSMCPP